jgi:CheY-like chemotaxis protein
MVKDIPDIDLIILDLQMPFMDGIEAAKRIRQIKPSVPIIAQSVFADENDIQKLFHAGCDDFISKPIDTNLLLSKIRLWNF